MQAEENEEAVAAGDALDGVNTFYHNNFRFVLHMADHVELEVFFAVICNIILTVLFEMAERSTSSRSNTIKEQVEVEWSEKGTQAIALAALGFCVMPLITLPMRRSSGIFALTMLLFMLFETVMFFIILGDFIYGVSIRIGP